MTLVYRLAAQEPAADNPCGTMSALGRLLILVAAGLVCGVPPVRWLQMEPDDPEIKTLLGLAEREYNSGSGQEDVYRALRISDLRRQVCTGPSDAGTGAILSNV